MKMFVCLHLLHDRILFTDFSEKVNERVGPIQMVYVELGGFVVPWEDMMVIMPAFTLQ